MKRIFELESSLVEMDRDSCHWSKYLWMLISWAQAAGDKRQGSVEVFNERHLLLALSVQNWCCCFLVCLHVIYTCKAYKSSCRTLKFEEGSAWMIVEVSLCWLIGYAHHWHTSLLFWEPIFLKHTLHSLTGNIISETIQSFLSVIQNKTYLSERECWELLVMVTCCSLLTGEASTEQWNLQSRPSDQSRRSVVGY